jgi:hypothetical protein
VFEGVPRIWLTVEVDTEKIQGVGSRYAIAMIDKRVSDAWWDYEEVDNTCSDAAE